MCISPIFASRALQRRRWSRRLRKSWRKKYRRC